MYLKLIKDSINQELNNVTSTIEGKTYKDENNLVLGLLVTFSLEILNLDISKEKVKELVQKFIKFYNIPNDQKDKIFMTIDSYTKELPIFYNKNIESETDSMDDKLEIDEDEIIFID